MKWAWIIANAIAWPILLVLGVWMLSWLLAWFPVLVPSLPWPMR